MKKLWVVQLHGLATRSGSDPAVPVAGYLTCGTVVPVVRDGVGGWVLVDVSGTELWVCNAPIPPAVILEES